MELAAQEDDAAALPGNRDTCNFNTYSHNHCRETGIRHPKFDSSVDEICCLGDQPLTRLTVPGTIDRVIEHTAVRQEPAQSPTTMMPSGRPRCFLPFGMFFAKIRLI